MSTIEDGTGTKRKAKVNDDHRLEVSAISNVIMAAESERHGDAFIFSSGDFETITSTNTETGILHLKNDSLQDLYIYSIRSGGDQINKWKLYKNSTGGTLITSEVPGGTSNLNLKSFKEGDVVVYKGSEGKTVSGGSMMEHWINNIGHSNEVFEGALILGKGDSIQLTVEVPVSGDICCRVIGYFK